MTYLTLTGTNGDKLRVAAFAIVSYCSTKDYRTNDNEARITEISLTNGTMKTVTETPDEIDKLLYTARNNSLFS